MLHKGSSIDNIHDLTDFPLERIKPLVSNIFSWFVPFLCYNIISLKTKGLIFLDIKFLSVKQKKRNVWQTLRRWSVTILHEIFDTSYDNQSLRKPYWTFAACSLMLQPNISVNFYFTETIALALSEVILYYTKPPETFQDVFWEKWTVITDCGYRFLFCVVILWAKDFFAGFSTMTTFQMTSFYTSFFSLLCFALTSLPKTSIFSLLILSFSPLIPC